MKGITGVQIRTAREAVHMSQKTLAGESKVSEKTIARLERGEPVRGTSLQRVARALRLKGPGSKDWDPGVWPQPPCPRGDPITLRTGLEVFDFFEETHLPRADIEVRSEIDGAVEGPLGLLVDAVELLRTPSPGPRVRFDAMSKLSSAMRVLRSRGWVVEGATFEQEVFGEDYDAVIFGQLAARRASSRRRESRKTPSTKGHA